MIRRPPRSTRVRSSAASDVYKRQINAEYGAGNTQDHKQNKTKNQQQTTNHNKQQTSTTKMTSNAGYNTPPPKTRHENDSETWQSLVDDREGISRHEFFMGVAEVMRHRSKDKAFKVGCCVVDVATRKILGLGYNGFLAGIENDEKRWVEDKDNYLQHAEVNGITFSNTDDLSDSIMYVTCLPCNDCALKIIQKRVRMVVFNITQLKYFEAPNVDSPKPALTRYFFESSNINFTTFNAIHQITNSKLKKSNGDGESNQSTSKVFIGLSDVFKPSLAQQSWNYTFMAVAVLASRRCCTSTEEHGAVICRDNKILSYGYAGLPLPLMNADIPKELKAQPLEKRKEYAKKGILCAIRNALCFAGDVKGSTVYTTKYPSLSAIRELIQRGVHMVIYLSDKPTATTVDVVEKLAIENAIALRSIVPPIYSEASENSSQSTYPDRDAFQQLCELEVLIVEAEKINSPLYYPAANDRDAIIPDLISTAAVTHYKWAYKGKDIPAIEAKTPHRNKLSSPLAIPQQETSFASAESKKRKRPPKSAKTLFGKKRGGEESEAGDEEGDEE
eukprot:TRINITY_DN7614_c0_g1_i1.p1 TRINITY_DN7614_c0_g1~~TRINITY_DN7614_c0_g1_i1.p1  ORF type:complete len:559 (-),score=104.12 TRINITY_DN7614_c0_g1_i1:61-1737(-)